MSIRIAIRVFGVFEFLLALFNVIFFGQFLPDLVTESLELLSNWRTKGIKDDAKVEFFLTWIDVAVTSLIIGFQFDVAYLLAKSTNVNTPLKTAIKSAQMWLGWNIFWGLVFFYWFLKEENAVALVALVFAIYRFIGSVVAGNYIEGLNIENNKPPLPISAPPTTNGKETPSQAPSTLTKNINSCKQDTPNNA